MKLSSKLRKLVYIMCGNGGLLLRFSQGKIKYKIDVKKEQKMEMDLH